MRRAGLVVAAAVAAVAIALAVSVEPSQGPGIGTIASARADSDDTAPAREVIGRSVRGKPIVATRYGDAASDRVALVVGVIHGDEHAGVRIVQALRRIAPTVEGTQLWLITTVNPDGLRTHTRKNAHGVDLNRNFPFRWRDDVPHSNGYYPGPRPASEPETKAVMAFSHGEFSPDLRFGTTSPGARCSPAGGDRRSQSSTQSWSACERAAGARACTAWRSPGRCVFPGSAAFVVEMPPGKISGGTADRQARAALTVAEGR